MSEILNHNIHLVASSIARSKMATPEVASQANEMKEKASANGYTKPLDAQVDAFALQHAAGPKPHPEISQGIQALTMAAEIPHKLPIFDTDKMEDMGAPKNVIDTASYHNESLQKGVDIPQ